MLSRRNLTQFSSTTGFIVGLIVVVITNEPLMLPATMLVFCTHNIALMVADVLDGRSRQS